MPRSHAGPPTLADLLEGRSRPRAAGVVLGRLVDLPVLGAGIARLARAPMRLRRLSGRTTRLHAWLLRRSGGRLRRSWLFAAGQPVLSLTTTGRRTGLPRTTAVACFTYGDDLALAGMNLGRPQDPGWTHNLSANPQATIDLAGLTVPVRARRATGAEAAQLWQQWVYLQPSAPAFQRLAGREIPLFVLTRR
ncbi:MAG: nitroreductase family deazaflavin-dependent oxidoreductase [Nocardioides sp.]|nr:nitroreductase family deazaflavin-dependent oxidoreductase [Nocardioides sp.]